MTRYIYELLLDDTHRYNQVPGRCLFVPYIVVTAVVLIVVAPGDANHEAGVEVAVESCSIYL